MTGFAGFTDDAFEFYEGLEADNSKTYWTTHKHIYDTLVRAPMQALLDGLADRFAATPVLFRPYRDVRFSADKSPYKTGQGAFLDTGSGCGYWISLGAHGISVGGGFHTGDRERTNRYRASVDDDTLGRGLVAITEKLVNQGYEIGGEQVRTKPRGVAADHPRLDLMRRSYLTASKPVPHDDALSKRFATTLAAEWERIRPLVDWCTAYAPPSE